MSLKENLQECLVADMKIAMRHKEVVKLETIRLLRAAIQRKEIDEKIQLDNDGVQQIIEKMIKQCSDAAEQFTKGNRADLADKEKANIAILETYLPDQLSDSEVDTLVADAIQQTGATTMKEMGKVIGLVKTKVQTQIAGRVDMGIVSTKIKAHLSQ